MALANDKVMHLISQGVHEMIKCILNLAKASLDEMCKCSLKQRFSNQGAVWKLYNLEKNSLTNVKRLK